MTQNEIDTTSAGGRLVFTIFGAIAEFERGIDLCHKTARLWWNRFGPVFAADIRRRRVNRMRGFRHWRWHLGEMYAKLNDEMVY